MYRVISALPISGQKFKCNLELAISLNIHIKFILHNSIKTCLIQGSFHSHESLPTTTVMTVVEFIISNQKSKAYTRLNDNGSFQYNESEPNQKYN